MQARPVFSSTWNRVAVRVFLRGFSGVASEASTPSHPDGQVVLFARRLLGPQCVEDFSSVFRGRVLSGRRLLSPRKQQDRRTFAIHLPSSQYAFLSRPLQRRP